MDSILITGGNGFIGSHVSLSLLKNGYRIIIFDSLINSSEMTIDKISEICEYDNSEISKKIKFVVGDIRDNIALDALFIAEKKNQTPISSVIHLAGLKSIRESLSFPIDYWDVNVYGSINLLKTMQKHKCFQIVFSSSASIYGFSDVSLVDENSKINPINTYSKTKVAVENFLNQIYCSATNRWKIACLRYFNPIGAHSSGLIGENPKGSPNNIFPLLIRAALKKDKIFNIFGGDWPTNDGTGIRDYIHVMDLAEGHLAAMNYLKVNNSQIINFNLGTSKGTSVLELIKTFEKVNKCQIPYKIINRREGDVSSLIANNKKALKYLNWRPKRSLEDMCRDGWKWQENNPKGYN
tara:strand:+ start:62725 stop:63780 length:1056 start_codon:yes stop_codon:yes gene_type:complete